MGKAVHTQGRYNIIIKAGHRVEGGDKHSPGIS